MLGVLAMCAALIGAAEAVSAADCIPLDTYDAAIANAGAPLHKHQQALRGV